MSGTPHTDFSSYIIRSTSLLSYPGYYARSLYSTAWRGVSYIWELVGGKKQETLPERATWGNDVEFLMSCIATSIGLGNVWRFPFVAYQNGGGAFLFPYLVVLFLIGKPMYYLECMIGQFSSGNCVTIWEMCPAMKGTGYLQAMGTGYILSYYVAIVAICLYYLVFSFRKTLPWAVCDKAWTDVICVPSQLTGYIENFENATSSAELYFLRTVLNQPKNIDNGIGYPIWYLVLCLLLSWVIIFLIVARGVKSSGKASYFLAIFPYVVMLILLITTCTLKGAGKGMLFFLTPQWNKLYDLKVWYAAVTQVFFSLTVCTGAIIMFSSYNGFRQNVYRDSLIVTSLDTFTSLLSGITIFGILGNLAHVLQRPVKEVVGTGGTGLAFISYPDAIAKTAIPQLFSVLFFLMMVVLGVGSAVALLLAIITVLLDAFPRVRTVYMSAFCCTMGFLVGIVYLTPGGQWILGLVDHFGGTFLVLFTGMSEIIGVMWFYGLENVCLDIEFMLGKGTCFFWRWCWAIITPALMIVVFIYALFNNTLEFGDQPYPFAALACGYALLIIGMLLVPLFIGKRMFQHRTGNCCEKGAERSARSHFGCRGRAKKDPSTTNAPEKGQSNAAFDASLEDTNNGVNIPTINVVEDVPYAENSKEPSAPEIVNIVSLESDKIEDRTQSRPKWDNAIEFLMSCIATSVGLGNVWRFPFVAYQNGGGAFLIPYIIVLLVIGKPMYYLETVLGQFSSSNCVKIWALSPAMKGTGYAQALGAGYVLSYYVSIIALCLYYLVMSFQSTLPWAVCRDEWENCVPSGESVNASQLEGNAVSSAELYFTHSVLRQSDGIHNGIGLPLWDLTICLLVSWIIIFLIVARGVKSSGKAAYFLAIFPYVVLFILLIRAVTLPGAGKGIMFFITPEWEKILRLEVWYAAVTQVFFSLSVCSGALIMFASYNGFRSNVYRDSMIVTTLDTFTSLISGITIFGVLGNLAYELGYDNVEDVVGSGGTSLAFISYPDAIAKSPFVPQLFAVLFFLMMAVLGIGSGVALLSTLNTVLLDAFPRVPTIFMASGACTAGFLVGLVYVTPGGQYILEIVDYYGGTFMRLFAAIAETIAVFWIYGLENLCVDIEFMLGIKTSWYWRICWSIVTPIVMITVFMYAMVTTEALVFGGTYVYPSAAYIAGNMLQYIGMALIPIFIVASVWKYTSPTFTETVKRAFKKKPNYGPSEPGLREDWRQFSLQAKRDRESVNNNWLQRIGRSLVGGHRKKQ